ncbi:MAG: hypothetical protein PWP38_3043 [Clostridiales bacterium]|jgi:hypothetical protein|nr:hypothetical protein [Clostridiales bacterium]
MDSKDFLYMLYQRNIIKGIVMNEYTRIQDGIIGSVKNKKMPHIAALRRIVVVVLEVCFSLDLLH